MINEKDIISLFSITLVAILGIITNILVIRYSQRQTISAKIIDKYFDIRDNIVNVLGEFASLKVDSVKYLV